MKQDLSIARVTGTSMILMVIAILFSACVTMPRNETAKTSSTEVLSSDRINLNTATVAELEALPGIGKAIAERIVSHREQYGRFRRSEHLLMVRGISEQKFQAIRSKVTVE